MAQLRSRLVEITAQGQTVNLLISEKQRDLLDAYGGKPIGKQLNKVALGLRDNPKSQKNFRTAYSIRTRVITKARFNSVSTQRFK